MRNRVLLAVMLVIGLLSFSAAFAQDATQAPPGEPTASANPAIGDITGNHETYYGQQVTIQGVVEEFLNARTFVVGEGSALLDNQLLVIDASGQEIPLTVARDQQVQLTGMVYPSIQEGGMDLVKSDLATADMTAPMVTEAPTVEAMGTAMVTEMPDAMMPTSEVTAGTTPMMATPAPMDLTPMPAPGTMLGTGMSTPDISSMLLPDGYADYTILLVTSVDSITMVVPQ